MSSPQTYQKSINQSIIKEIKVSPKRFLVMVNPVQLKLEIKKAPATAGAFSVSKQYRHW